MRNLLGMCSLLLLGATAFAQSGTTYIIPSAAPSSLCPVTLTASRLGGEHMLTAQRPATGTRHTNGIALRLGLFSGLAKNHGIAAARITLHGMANSALVPAGQLQASESSESLPIRPERVQPFFFSTVYTHKLTGIQTVELNEITYADGSTWQEALPGTCVVQPNPFVRVNAAQ